MNYTDKLKVELYDEVVNEKNKQYIELSCRLRENCNDIKKKDKEIERLNKRWKVLRTYINEMWLDDKGSVRRLQEFVKLLENGDDKE